MPGRSCAPSELQRVAKCKRLARRMSVLPCSHAFKASLASLVLSPVVSWGLLLGGRVPSRAEVSNHLTLCRKAVQGSTGGHESVAIQQVLLLGHTSDLLCVSFQRAVKALHKWRASAGFPNLVDSSFLTSLSQAATRLGGRFLLWGPFGLGILLGIRLPPLPLRTPTRMGSVTFGGSPLSSVGFGLLGAMRALRETRVFVSRTSSFRNCVRARRVWTGMLAKSCVGVFLLKRTAHP